MGALRDVVADVGGGIVGVCSALGLENAYDAIVPERLDRLLTQISRSNVGGIDRGFHDALDATMDTAAPPVPAGSSCRLAQEAISNETAETLARDDLHA